MTTVTNDMPILTPHIKKRQVKQPRTPGGKNKRPTKKCRTGVLSPTKLVFAEAPECVAADGIIAWAGSILAAFDAADAIGPN